MSLPVFQWMLNVKIHAQTTQSGAVCGNAKADSFWVGILKSEQHGGRFRSLLQITAGQSTEQDWDQCWFSLLLAI